MLDDIHKYVPFLTQVAAVIAGAVASILAWTFKRQVHRIDRLEEQMDAVATRADLVRLETGLRTDLMTINSHLHTLTMSLLAGNRALPGVSPGVTAHTVTHTQTNTPAGNS